MNNKEQDNYNNATLASIKKFIDSNQRKRINSLTQIESEVENIFNLGPSLFDIFDSDGDDWAAGWILQVLKKFKPEFFEKSKFNNWFNTYSDIDINYEDLSSIILFLNVVPLTESNVLGVEPSVTLSPDTKLAVVYLLTVTVVAPPAMIVPTAPDVAPVNVSVTPQPLVLLTVKV